MAVAALASLGSGMTTSAGSGWISRRQTMPVAARWAVVSNSAER